MHNCTIYHNVFKTEFFFILYILQTCVLTFRKIILLRKSDDRYLFICTIASFGSIPRSFLPRLEAMKHLFHYLNVDCFMWKHVR